MTYTEVKKIVEEVTGIENIGDETRKMNISDARFVYYALCNRLVDRDIEKGNSIHYERMGLTVNRDRTSVIYGLSQWNTLKDSNFWWGSWVYKLAIETLKNRLKSKIWKGPEIDPINCIETEFAIVK